MNGVELVASWLTPTVLFCVMNVMIGTIFFRSSLKPPRTKQQNREELEAAAAAAAAAAAPRFERVSSFLERVKSFNLARYEAEHQSDPVHRGFPDPEPTASEEEEIYHEIEESHHVRRDNSGEAVREREEARHVARTTSAAVAEAAREREEAYHVERINSAAVAELEAEAAREREEAYHEIKEPHHVARTSSALVAKPAPAAKALKKSASEKMLTVKEKEEEEEEYQRRPETARMRGPGDTEVDGKADDFIIKFRKQLKLQRMDSIVRYNDMIDRGAGW